LSAALDLGVNETVAEWESEGLELGERERSAASLMWDIGDWWNRGERYGGRAKIVTASDWTGPSYASCRRAGSVAERFGSVSRLTDLSFEHHAIVAPLPDEQAVPLLQWCRDAPQPRSVQELRTRVKQLARAAREAELGDAQAALSGRYGVIYADPPWRFEPYSRETGMDRAADNHYPTMTLDDIRSLPVPAADDAVLFLWATSPMLPEAIEVMTGWGFTYKSHFIWVKDRIGTGYWSRNRHELLLVGTRGEIPAPAPGEQFVSVINAAAGEHSAKPAAFAEMIEEMFPSLPAIELFARGPRLGWDVWGNESNWGGTYATRPDQDQNAPAENSQAGTG
jgi:N6-adenosine-specific RNA methylase IME4